MIDSYSVRVLLRNIFNKSPVHYEDIQPMREHLIAAIEWIRNAHQAVDKLGVSKGYDLLRGCWYSAYPETTGYTIPTLLNASNLLNDKEVRLLSLSLADYLLQCTTDEGGVKHWLSDIHNQPIVFDTGQVIFGLLSAYEASKNQHYLDAAMRAGKWLVSIQHPSGCWKSNQYLNVVKVIDTRVDWALLELSRHDGSRNYMDIAIRNLDWALQYQNSDGWFKNCAFIKGGDPITHTLAYTAEGLLECGLILCREDYIDSARLLADALLKRQYDDGRLASRFSQGWIESSKSSCLTGNCQVSILWLKFFELTGKQEYFNAAQKALSFVIRTQDLDTMNKNVRGAIPGSYPIYGEYERFKYPNWATKFYIDALLKFFKLKNNHIKLIYRG